MAARPSGLCVEQVGKESVEPGDERGAPSPSSEPSINSPSRDEQAEEDGALGVSGGQPDVSPSGPHDHNNTPEPKVKILFELGTRHILRAFASYFQFRVKSDF